MSHQVAKRKQSGHSFKALMALPFLASVVVHLVIFLLVGTVVVFEGTIPRQIFDSFDSGAYEAGSEFTPPPLMEEEPLDTEVPMESPLEVMAPSADQALTPDASMDIITADTTSSAPSFFMPSNSGMSIGPSESPTISAPKAGGKKSDIAKSLMFDTAQRKASTVNFFKVKQVASRVVIAIDVSKSMVDPKRGGIEGYAALKAEVEKIIDGLSEETAFNLIMFGGKIDLFQPKLVPATDSYRKDAKRWFAPYMANFDNATKGNLNPNYNPPKDLSLSTGGSSRMDNAITAAFEQGADAIFLVSDGAPVASRTLDEEDKKWLRQAQQAMEDALAAKIETKEAEKLIKEAGNKIKDKSVDMSVEKLHRRIKQEKELAAMSEENRKQKLLGMEGKIGYWAGKLDNKKIIDHIKTLYTKLYSRQGRQMPVIHAVGYMADPAGAEFMQMLSNEFKGKYSTIDSTLKK